MLYSEKMPIFTAKRPAQTVTVDGAAYARDMFETIFKDFQQTKDMHITGLLEDLMNQTPVTEADFRALKGRILLIFPSSNAFFTSHPGS